MEKEEKKRRRDVEVANMGRAREENEETDDGGESRVNDAPAKKAQALPKAKQSNHHHHYHHHGLCMLQLPFLSFIVSSYCWTATVILR
jgi:hypothetical protein